MKRTDQKIYTSIINVDPKRFICFAVTHLITDFVILVLPNYFKFIFAFRFPVIDLPLMAILLAVLVISGIGTVVCGIKVLRSKPKNKALYVLIAFSFFSVAFWALFLSMEIIFPH